MICFHRKKTYKDKFICGIHVARLLICSNPKCEKEIETWFTADNLFACQIVWDYKKIMEYHAIAKNGVDELNNDL